MEKGKVVTAIIVLATIILAGVAVFTALRLYDRGPEPVSPSAPSSQPQATNQTPVACEALVFNLEEEPSPTPTGQASPTPTNTPSPTPTGTLSPTNTPSPTPTDNPIGGADPTPTNTPTPTTGQTASNPTATPTTGTIAQASPTQSGDAAATDDELPEAGDNWPVAVFGLASVLLIILGLAIAL